MAQSEIDRALARLEKRRESVLEGVVRAVQAGGMKQFPLDLLLMGAAKRTMQLLSGFGTLVRTRNLMSAGALLRMQIDTGLRFAAAWLVNEPHAFALSVIRGTRMDKLKTKAGLRMTDAELVRHFSKAAGDEWIARVYSETCAFVHLSGKHVFSTVLSPPDKLGHFELEICEVDRTASDDDIVEAVDAFEAAVGFFLRYVHGWAVTKELGETDPKRFALLKKDRQSNAGSA